LIAVPDLYKEKRRQFMRRDFDLLSLGEILLRLSPPDNERIVRGDTFQKQVGGAELNVVSGVSLLGLRTGMISMLPDNALGTYAKNRVRFCGVSDDYLIYDKDTDARLGIYYYENGAYPRKPSVVYDRKHASFCKFSADDFPEEMYGSTRCFHTTGITLALSENVSFFLYINQGLQSSSPLLSKCSPMAIRVSFHYKIRLSLHTA
jgi:2-dehydro-3-deoxygluconokinase